MTGITCHEARALVFSLSLVLLSLSFSIFLTLSTFLPLTSSLHSPLSLSISLLLLLLSGNALTVACKESGHCAARKQKPRLRERARISIIEYTYILRKGTMTKAPFRQNFRARTRVASRVTLGISCVKTLSVITPCVKYEFVIIHFFSFPFRRSIASEMYIGLRKKKTRYFVAKKKNYFISH